MIRPLAMLIPDGVLRYAGAIDSIPSGPRGGIAGSLSFEAA